MYGALLPGGNLHSQPDRRSLFIRAAAKNREASEGVFIRASRRNAEDGSSEIVSKAEQGSLHRNCGQYILKKIILLN